MRDEARNSVYDTWSNFKRRCSNPSHPRYADYGGRGITVCERWKEFEMFFQDMGPRPEGMTLERVDNNGGYSPENCQWATPKQQSSNRRNCIYIEIGGEKITLKEACRRQVGGLSYRVIHNRITRDGWDIKEALETPSGGRRNAKSN